MSVEPIELARLRRLAENPAIATLSDEHVAAIRWAVAALQSPAADEEYKITVRYPHGQWQSWPVDDESRVADEFEAAIDDAALDAEVMIRRRRIGRWETIRSAMGRKGGAPR